MAKLTAQERAALPDSAFAYVDSVGKRRLPINDTSHVRNALARFGQVKFEDDEAREGSRKRLLNAAKRHGIVPIGFITGQLSTARKKVAAARIVIDLGRIESINGLQKELRETLNDPTLALLRWSKAAGSYIGCDNEPVSLPSQDSPKVTTFLQGRGRPITAIVHDRSVLNDSEISEAVLAAVHLVVGREVLEEERSEYQRAGLPEGVVTFLLTDIEGSTGLLATLGERYAALLGDVRVIIRQAVLTADGREVEARADEFVAVFESADSALEAAIDMQRALADKRWPDSALVRIRVGVHRGPISLTESGYVGLTVHTVARIMAAAKGGQILASRDTVEGASNVDATTIGFQDLRGLAVPVELFEILC